MSTRSYSANFSKYTFSKKGLVDLLQQYEDDSLNPSDFVETIIP